MKTMLSKTQYLLYIDHVYLAKEDDKTSESLKKKNQNLCSQPMSLYFPVFKTTRFSKQPAQSYYYANPKDFLIKNLEKTQLF